MLGKLSYRDQSKVTKRRYSKSILNKPIAIASLTIGCLISVGIVGFVQGQKAELRAKSAEVKQLLHTDPVAGLVLAIQATGQNHTRLPWEMLPEVQSSLLSAVQTARERNRFEQPGQVHTATFTPDGQHIAAAGGAGAIYLWDLQNTQTQILQGDGQAIGSIQFSPDGAAVFGNPATEAGMVQFWTLQEDAAYLPPPSYALSAAFRSDGQMLISGSTNGRVQLWNRQGEWIANLYPRQSGSITAVAFEGSSIVSGGADGNLTLWDTKGNLQGQLWAGAKVTSLLLSHGGQRIISEDLNRQQAFIWDAQAGRWNQFLLGETSTVRSATLNPDNTIIARGNLDGSVQLLPLNSPSRRFQPQSLVGHQGMVNSVTFSSDGQTVISGGEDGSVRLWDVWDGTLLAKSHLQEWSNDSIVTEISTLENPSQNSGETQGSIASTASNSDGTRITASSPDGTILLSDIQGNLIGQFITSHQAPIQSVTFGGNGETIVSVDQQGEVRVWQASWQSWLETACNRLQFHPVFQSPSTSEARSAKSTCQRYIWNSTNQSSDSYSNPLAVTQLAQSTNSQSTNSQSIDSQLTNSQSANPESSETAPMSSEIRVVVKLGERKIYVYQGDHIQASYPIAVGQTGWDTPTGTFRVFEMLQDPAWTHPITRERVEPGANNPLGSRWIAFWSDEANKIGFHGTPDRNSVGQAVSHGCLRMYDEDARALYEQIQLGTVVIVEP